MTASPSTGPGNEQTAAVERPRTRKSCGCWHRVDDHDGWGCSYEGCPCLADRVAAGNAR